MSALINNIKGIFSPIKPLKAGVYHFQSPPHDPLNYRLHLRIEPNGSGILLVNASTVLHLNQTASEYAYHIVNRTPTDEAAKAISRRYKIKPSNALADLQALNAQVMGLLTAPDLDPVMFFGFDRKDPIVDDLSAPYRLDCALTYRLPNGTPVDSSPVKRVDRELTTEEWKTIIDKAWQAGIPHILFTGGEPTLRDDLVELILYAEKNGQVTGLLTDGMRLGDTNYLNSLLQAGLDHTMIVLQPDKDNTWDALSSFAYWKDTLDEDIFIAAHLTITKSNSSQSINLIDKITEVGVSAISLSVNDQSLTDELNLAREYIASRNIDLVWDLPVPYSSLNPVALELEEHEGTNPYRCDLSSIYIEPDGDVLPAQGINNVIGNMLTDDWDKIWKKAQHLK